uniref:F-box domain-containing protein n=1 Tax=Guillardia theta TaxID=55529 RepID=A0A7S4NW29_GUITH|mmetsp:Transcript_34783/g.108877  ORF Transcript_34783/g.108877 Transcript_34783/m.108877 type:complete len:459 (+) Transcript_34783:284-1660(+)
MESRGSDSSDDLDDELERLFDSKRSNVTSQPAAETCMIKNLELHFMPEEVVIKILMKLPVFYICMLSCACKRYSEICRSSRQLWKALFVDRWGGKEECRPHEHPLSNGWNEIEEGDYDKLYQYWHVVDNNWQRGLFSVHSLEGHRGSVNSCKLLGETLLTVGEDRTIGWWDLESLTCTWVEQNSHSGSVWDLATFDDYVVTSSADSTLKLWQCGVDQISGSSSPMSCLRILKGHRPGYVWCCDMDGGNIYSGSADTTVKVWDFETGSNYQTLKAHNSSVFVVRASKDNGESSYSPHKSLLSVSSDGKILLWDLRTEKTGLSFTDGTEENPVFSADLIQEQNLIIVGSGDKCVKKFDIRTGECLATLIGHDDSIWSICYNSLSRRLVSGSVDCGVRVWDCFSDTCIAEMTCHMQSVCSVAADARRVVSGDIGGWIFIWDFERKNVSCEYQALMTHTGPM